MLATSCPGSKNDVRWNAGEGGAPPPHQCKARTVEKGNGGGEHNPTTRRVWAGRGEGKLNVGAAAAPYPQNQHQSMNVDGYLQNTGHTASALSSPTHHTCSGPSESCVCGAWGGYGVAVTRQPDCRPRASDMPVQNVTVYTTSTRWPSPKTGREARTNPPVHDLWRYRPADAVGAVERELFRSAIVSFRAPYHDLSRDFSKSREQDPLTAVKNTTEFTSKPEGPWTTTGHGPTTTGHARRQHKPGHRISASP